MSLVVVRCPACLGESRVATDALGEMVACPRCEVPFIAAEEVPVVQPVARAATAPRRAFAIPIAPPRPRTPYPDADEGDSELTADAKPTASPAEVVIPDPVHDPHLPPVAGLPVSVLVGLALLPLAIPPLWWAAPKLTGQEPSLSLAVPISLAIAAATLCFGVVYTIDWTAATRIKGVMMLVGLAYLSAAGLFFLKKDLVDEVRAFFGPKDDWKWVFSKEGQFRVRMRGEITASGDQPLPRVKMTGGQRANYHSDNDDEYIYLATSGVPDNRPAQLDDAWFEAIDAHLAQTGKITDRGKIERHADGEMSRQWTLQVKDNTNRVVRVIVHHDRVYYLSAEGRNLTPTDELAEPFFRSFVVLANSEKPKPKRKR